MNCDIPDLLGFVPGARGDVCVELDLVDEGVRGADAVEVFYDFWSRRVEGGPGFVLVEGEGVECCRAGLLSAFVHVTHPLRRVCAKLKEALRHTYHKPLLDIC